MGACFSDMQGGKQAVGGTQMGPTGPSSGDGGGGAGGLNEAVDFFYKARGFAPLYTQLELSLSAKNLRDMDIMSKSDPMVVVYLKKRDGMLDEIGRTEVVLNSLSPIWIKKISIAYQFEIVQPLVFHVYDIDTRFHNLPVKALNLRDQDFLGEANCVLSEIVTKRDCSLTMTLQNKQGYGQQRNLGSLTVHAEEAVPLRTAVELVLHCKHLDNKDLLSKSDPFLRISRIVEAGQVLPICKTEVVKNNLNPTWKPTTLTIQQFGSKDNPLIIECFDFNSSGNHELIGKLQKSVQDLENMQRDKTGANFVRPHRGHEKAIMAVGEVIQFYDSDKRFPTWGFGGSVNGSVSHCFNLNGNSYDAEVTGVEGIMAAYSSALQSVALAGPTLFCRVIDKAAGIVAQSLAHDLSKYYILLIITDGELCDLQETKDALVKASTLPLSILIVGVGNADFTQVQILDADTGPQLQSTTGQLASRDIVQFVPMRDVQRDEISVTQALLEELPAQFLTFMRSRNIKPQMS